MSTNEIKKLRKSGRLDEAYVMAKSAFELNQDDIWVKRNLAWVLYEYLKIFIASEDFKSFQLYLQQLIELHLPGDEKYIFDQISWQIGKMIFQLSKNDSVNYANLETLFRFCQLCHFSKPSDSYSFLFKAFHKALKDNQALYHEFFDWWNFSNFMDHDFKKDRLTDGRNVLSIAEQAIIAYSKNILFFFRQKKGNGELAEKVHQFLKFLDDIMARHTDMLYPAYYKAKLLIAISDSLNILPTLLPFARRKKNEFWIWDLIGEALPNDDTKIISCYCKSLLCNANEEYLINIRQKLAKKLISAKMYSEAKTELVTLVNTRRKNSWKIPPEVQEWMMEEWYHSVNNTETNFDFYKSHKDIAEKILYLDLPEHIILIENINWAKKSINFISSDGINGFFNFHQFNVDLQIGDTANVRFEPSVSNAHYVLYSIEKTRSDIFSENYLKIARGKLKIKTGNPFGFVEDCYIHPVFIEKHKLISNQQISVKAIKSFNSKKQLWSWKAYEIL